MIHPLPTTTPDGRIEPTGQRVMGWIAPATWPAVVATLANRPDADELVLVAAADSAESLPSPGLLGRGRRGERSASETLTRDAAERLLRHAAEALGRPCQQVLVQGRTERVISEQAQQAQLLILARDGDLSHLGPSSLGHATRFVIDHAPCKVEVVWPEQAPSLSTMPPAPAGR